MRRIAIIVGDPRGARRARLDRRVTAPPRASSPRVASRCRNRPTPSGPSSATSARSRAPGPTSPKRVAAPTARAAKCGMKRSTASTCGSSSRRARRSLASRHPRSTRRPDAVFGGRWIYVLGAGGCGYHGHRHRGRLGRQPALPADVQAGRAASEHRRVPDRAWQALRPDGAAGTSVVSSHACRSSARLRRIRRPRAADPRRVRWRRPHRSRSLRTPASSWWKWRAGSPSRCW